MKKKISYEQFLKEAKEIHGDKYEYNEEDYYNKDKKSRFRIKCKEHGYFYETYFNHVKLKRGCKICYDINKKEKHIEYIKLLLEKAKKIHNNRYDYSLVDLTKSVKEKNIIICPIHGKFKMTLDNHINGKQKCGKCTLVRYNFDDFKKMSFEKFGEDAFDFSETVYTTWEKNITFKCNKCGKIIKRLPKTHLTTKGCPFCSKQNKKIKESEKWINFKKNKPNHIDISKAIYNGNDKEVILYCNKKDKYGNIHGEYKATPTSIFRSVFCMCPKCTNRQPRTTEKCINEFKKKYGDFFIYDKFEYFQKNDSIITCPKHGDFKTNYYKMMHNIHGCPKCASENYYYEEKLKKLITNTFNTKIEYNLRPEWLINKKSKHKQELDIFIPEYNIAIEYQGRHHFINLYNDINKFNKTKELDTEKYEMCKKLGIKLLYFTNDKRDLPNEYIDKIYTNEDELISEIKRLIN